MNHVYTILGGNIQQYEIYNGVKRLVRAGLGVNF